MTQGNSGQESVAKGIEFMKQGNLDAALKCFDRAIQLNPHDAQNYLLKAATSCNAKRFQEALDAANEGLQLKPNDEALLSIRAMALMDVGPGDALKAFQEVTKLYPESKQAWINLANYYTAIVKGKVGSAVLDALIIDALEKAVALDPAEYRLLGRLTLLYIKNNDHVMALSYLERIAQIRPDFLQELVPETKQKIAQGLSRPFKETLKIEVRGGGGTIEGPATSIVDVVCTKCGEKLPPNAKFCNKCGQKMA